MRALAFSRDSRRVAAVDEGGRAHVWEADGGRSVGVTPQTRWGEFEPAEPESRWEPSGLAHPVTLDHGLVRIHDPVDGHVVATVPRT